MKTNAMRILDKQKLKYDTYSYINSSAISGKDVANYLQVDYDCVYKTLVTIGKSKKYYVYMVAVDQELDLKKAAECVNEKAIEMININDLFKVTGYVHGGCSPIGMKKQFNTIIDKSILDKDKIIFSGGKIGYQIEIELMLLSKVLDYQVFDIIKK